MHRNELRPMTSGPVARAARRARGVIARATVVTVLAVAAAGAAGCSAAPAGPPAPGSSSPGNSPVTGAPAPGTPSSAPAPPSPAASSPDGADPAEALLAQVRDTADTPDGRGLSRTGGEGRTRQYLWETKGGKICWGNAGSASATGITCLPAHAVQTAHTPELAPLFGPGADVSGSWYLVVRVGHGTPVSFTLAGKPVTGRLVRTLEPRAGGGDAYSVPLTHWPHHERLVVRVSVDGREKTLTMDVDL